MGLVQERRIFFECEQIDLSSLRKRSNNIAQMPPFTSPEDEDHHHHGIHNKVRNGCQEAETKESETITVTKESEIVTKESEIVTKESEILKEVLRMNEILSNQEESETQLSLCRLESMPLSVEILKASLIGPKVKLLRKHKSKAIRSMAKKLVRKWREVADEHEQMKKAAANVVPTIAAPVQQIPHHKTEQPLKVDDSQCCKQEAKNHIVLSPKTRQVVNQQNLHKDSDFNKPASLPLPSPHKSSSPSLDEKSLSQKIEAARKRLQEGYRQIANVKKQRAVQLIQITDLPEQQPSQQQRKKMKNF